MHQEKCLQKIFILFFFIFFLEILLINLKKQKFLLKIIMLILKL